MTQGLSDAALLVTGRDPTSAEAGPWARQWLWSKAASIAGGTSQVQRDIIAGTDPGPAALTGVACDATRTGAQHARRARGRGVTCSMRGKELLSRRAASNLAAAKMDLAGATAGR